MSGPAPLAVKDLIFPHASQNDVHKVLGDLKRSTLSLHNRLHSILDDAAFVHAVARAYRLPLVANERCGSWYMAPDARAQRAYFKSTDGHAGQWAFSLRRLNLQLLATAGAHGGCVVVDSTRRGKRVPDALAKTVPIWIAVLNRVLFPQCGEAHVLRTPRGVVSPSEHAQIEARLQGFVRDVQALGLELGPLRDVLGKPLRPIWVTQESTLPVEVPVVEDWLPVVLCTASRRVLGGEASEGGYIQGAADDSESWAHGLTAEVFWEHKEALLSRSEEELPGFIAALMQQHDTSGSSAQCTLIKPTTQVYVGTTDAAAVISSEYAVVITCGPPPVDDVVGDSATVRLHLPCGTGKVGSRRLRHELPKLPPLLNSVLVDARRRMAILVTCATGKDHSIGIALAILCLFADDNGCLEAAKDHGSSASQVNMSKQLIKQRLSWIMVSIPAANPSRATLQSVNAFLLG